MTLLVRDEEDILAANFDFHLAQGVDLFIVTDNLSVDGTRDIIEDYVRLGVAVYLREDDDTFAQFRWVTRMARLASSRYQADWVVNSDADEFWTSQSPGMTLKEVLGGLGPEKQAAIVPRKNFVPVDEKGEGLFAERMRLIERESFNTEGEPLPAKMCHRAFDDIDVEQGNHSVGRAGNALSGIVESLRILHYPVRSYRQFELKIIHGGAAYARNRELPPKVGRTWRHLYELWQAGGLRNFYTERLLREQEVESRLLTGELTYDDTVLDVLHRTRREKTPAVVFG